MPLPLRDVAVHSGLDLKATVVQKLARKVQVGETVRYFLPRVVDPSFQEVFGIKPAGRRSPEGLDSP